MEINDFCKKWNIECPSGEQPEGIHMEKDSLEVLGKTESKHFWARTKAYIVHKYIQTYLKKQKQDHVCLLDIGCGNGATMQQVQARHKSMQCTGIDGYLAALQLARERLPDARLILLDLLHMGAWDESGKFNVLTLLDVIEHLDDPVAVLADAKTHVSDDGIMIVSVPAMQSLWSERDVFLGHRKRYSKAVLMQEMQQAGWTVLHCSYAFSFMFLPAYLLRKILFPFRRANGQQMEATELRVVPIVNELLLVLGMVETLLRTYIPTPFGTSVYCVVKKSEDTGA